MAQPQSIPGSICASWECVTRSFLHIHRFVSSPLVVNLPIMCNSYPLVNIQKVIENGRKSQLIHLFMVIFHSEVCVCVCVFTRVYSFSIWGFRLYGVRSHAGYVYEFPGEMTMSKPICCRKNFPCFFKFRRLKSVIRPNPKETIEMYIGNHSFDVFQVFATE